MKTTAEVLIIGGGVNGCAAAYYLAKEGVDVIVLEGSPFIGNGGSSRNGGGVRQSGRDPRELPYVMWGIQELWPGLSEELGADVEYYQQGNLRLAKTEAHLKTLQNLTDRAKAAGLDVRMVSAAEAKAINPYLSETVIGASWCATDGHANPLRTTLAFYRRARQLGAQFFTDMPVKNLRKIGGKARQVVTLDGTVFEAENIVVAAGYASRRIVNTVGIDVPIDLKVSETLVTEAQPHLFWQMLGTAAADFYGHQTLHGSFIFGGSTGYDQFTAHDETTLSVPPATSIHAPYICRAVMGYFPQLANAKIVRAWGGWTDLCADGVPVISRVDEVPGLILACGFTGHGFGSAPAVGRLLAEMAMGQELTINLDALRYDRFLAKDRKHAV
ncbi:MAG: FAD-binding oxidoreductase [Ethanoligenens sp.]